jgi:hypothetical protein
MRFQRLCLALLSTLLLATVAACGPSAEEEAQQKEAEDKAAKAKVDRANALSLSKETSQVRPDKAAPELIDKLHEALSKKPQDVQAVRELAKATRHLEAGILLAALTGPPPKLAAPWPETVSLAHSLADAQGKEILSGSVARSEIFKQSAGPYSAYVALSKRSDPLDQALAAVVAVKYATFAAKDFVGNGKEWMRFVSNHICTGEGCVLPEVLSKLPPAVDGHLSARAIAMAQTLNHLHGLATAQGVPEHLAEKLKKQAAESLATVKLPVYADLLAKPEPEVAVVPLMAWAMIRHPDFILSVRADHLGLASRTEVRLGDDGPVWHGGLFTKLVSLEDLDAKPAARSKKIAAAVAELKKQTEGSEARIALQVAPDASGTLVAAGTEILAAAEVRAPRTLITDGGMPGGLAVWCVDLEERPEEFPENSLDIRRTKDAWVLQWPSALPDAVDASAILPDSVSVKTLGRGKRAQARITVKITEEGAALATLKAALALLKGHFGLEVEAVRMNVTGAKDGAWVQSLLAAAQRNEATQPKAWIEGALAENNELGGIRSVAIKTLAVSKKEKAKTPSKPKALPPALGYCQKRDIERVMKSRRGAFKFCYQRSLQMNPSLTGKIVTRFRINDEGSVTNAIVLSNTMDDRNVPKCLISNVKKLKFPRPQGGQCEVRWPFNFQSR